MLICHSIMVNTQAYKFYCNKDLAGAHGAEADSMATFEVLVAQLELYDSLKGDVDFLSEFSSVHKNVDLAGRIVKNEKGEEVIIPYYPTRMSEEERTEYEKKNIAKWRILIKNIRRTKRKRRRRRRRRLRRIRMRRSRLIRRRR